MACWPGQLIPRLYRDSKMKSRCNNVRKSTYHPCPMYELEVRAAFSGSWIPDVRTGIIEGWIGNIYMSLVRCFGPMNWSEIVRRLGGGIALSPTNGMYPAHRQLTHDSVEWLVKKIMFAFYAGSPWGAVDSADAGCVRCLIFLATSTLPYEILAKC